MSKKEWEKQLKAISEELEDTILFYKQYSKLSWKYMNDTLIKMIKDLIENLKNESEE